MSQVDCSHDPWTSSHCDSSASAADLELLSTIVHADREASQARRRMAFFLN
jgi:hypothetical protein